MQTFEPGLSARIVHDRLVAALQDLQRAEKSAVLWFADVMERRLYLELGFTSIHDYATEALGFSRTKTYQFIRFAESFRGLPALRKAVGEGDVSWTKAREVVKVATPKNEEAWIAIAGTESRRDLERRVAATRSRAKAVRRMPGQTTMAVLDPVVKTGLEAADGLAAIEEIPYDIHWRLTPEQGARYEALVERIRKLGERGDKADLLLAGLAALAEEGERKRRTESESGTAAVSSDDSSPRGDDTPARVHTTSPYQVVVQVCPRCDTGAVVTNRGERGLDPASLRSILCDAVVQGEDGKNKSAIPPRLRRQVLARDGYRCRVGSCARTRFLQVHHVVPREAGGPNRLDQLITTCGSCHRALHGEAKEMRLRSSG